MPEGLQQRPRAMIAASLMCADFTRFYDQLDELAVAGIRRLHLDFADGTFVPNLILGTEVFGLLAARREFMVESHLMIDRPGRFLELFTAGSDLVVVHVEALKDAAACLERIRQAGPRTGIALAPDTPAADVGALLPLVNMVLVMTVRPGFSGGRFLPDMRDKVARVRQMISSLDLNVEIEVDGAINERTIPMLADAGADVFVGGSSGLFDGSPLQDSARLMIAAAEAGRGGRAPSADSDLSLVERRGP
jgi:ribulose-phosphate 3-epimerase